MEWKVSAGNTKKRQIKDLERYCEYHKEGNKFIIDEVFDIPLPKEDNKRNSSNFTKYKQLNIKCNEFNNIGVYYILLKNSIYIGSTIRGFRERFQEHYRGNDQRMIHTFIMLQNNGNFNILYDMTGVKDNELIRQVENEFIQYFINETEYNVINQIKGWDIIVKKKKYKNIKIEKEYYNKALCLLIENDLFKYIK